MLDYLSDFICCLYGKPGAYGESAQTACWAHAAAAALLRPGWVAGTPCLSRGCVLGGDRGLRSLAPAWGCSSRNGVWPLTCYDAAAPCTGVVTLPFSVREGINIFLGGFVPTENLRFREESLSFKVAVWLCGCGWVGGWLGTGKGRAGQRAACRFHAFCG